MEWIECTLSCGNDTDSVCDKLAALGVGGMSVENEEDFKILAVRFFMTMREL